MFVIVEVEFGNRGFTVTQQFRLSVRFFIPNESQ